MADDVAAVFAIADPNDDDDDENGNNHFSHFFLAVFHLVGYGFSKVNHMPNKS